MRFAQQKPTEDRSRWKAHALEQEGRWQLAGSAAQRRLSAWRLGLGLLQLQ
jgi:hypothetical protein